MRRWLILAALLPLALTAYLLLAIAVGRWLKACDQRARREIVNQVVPPLCDCEACDPDAQGRLR